jgi:hypothetical protein
MASIKSISDIVTNQRQGLTGTQQAMVDAAPEEQRPFLQAQFKLENESQATQQISNILKKLDEMSSAVIRNLA